MIPRLEPQNSVLLVVDIQDKLLPAMHDGEACVAAAGRMIEAAKVLGVPIIATEQYPAGLGKTCAVLASSLDDAHVEVYEKTLFSVCVEPVKRKLAALARPNIIVVGIESHVCVQQSVLDLLRMGQVVYVCADAITSRRASDRQFAIERMRQAGAIVTTTESAIFEILGQAGTEQFKRILKIVK